MDDHHLCREDFSISSVGTPSLLSPRNPAYTGFITGGGRILYSAETPAGKEMPAEESRRLSFEMAGPRERLFFSPAACRCAIVTCGGLCPGINDVIRAIVYEAYEEYGVKDVYGFQYGYKGMVKDHDIPPVRLDTDIVNSIHEIGGTILSSSRGPQDPRSMVDFLEELSISVVFTIGGDGTLRGARALAKEIHKRALLIAVIGIPKTIDNDIPFVEKTFGFETAVAASREVIQSAHVESKGTENGIGLVKLMGRDSGFIAAQATLANADVNFCLIPEVDFTLEGPGGFLQQLETRLRRRRHAVIVVAEGAGQPLMSADPRTDASGNILYEDIGVYLKNRIADYFRRIDMPASVKYIDPSYIIRSKPANANDSLFCLRMGQHAVHAGLSGKTEMMVGYWNQHFTHVPLKLATLHRKKVDPRGELWRTVLAVTEQGQPGQNAQ